MKIERSKCSPLLKNAIELIHNFIDSGGRVYRLLAPWEDYFNPLREKVYSEYEFWKELEIDKGLFSRCNFSLRDKDTDTYTDYRIQFTRQGNINLISESGELFENKKIYNPKRLRDVIEKFINDGGFLLLNTIKLQWKQKQSPYRAYEHSNDSNVSCRKEIYDINKIMDIVTNKNKNKNIFFEFLKKGNEKDNREDALVFSIIINDNGNFEFEKENYTECNNPIYKELESMVFDDCLSI